MSSWIKVQIMANSFAIEAEERGKAEYGFGYSSA